MTLKWQWSWLKLSRNLILASLTNQGLNLWPRGRKLSPSLTTMDLTCSLQTQPMTSHETSWLSSLLVVYRHTCRGCKSESHFMLSLQFSSHRVGILHQENTQPWPIATGEFTWSAAWTMTAIARWRSWRWTRAWLSGLTCLTRLWRRSTADADTLRVLIRTKSTLLVGASCSTGNDRSESVLPNLWFTTRLIIQFTWQRLKESQFNKEKTTVLLLLVSQWLCSEGSLRTTPLQVKCWLWICSLMTGKDSTIKVRWSHSSRWDAVLLPQPRKLT